ncbi:MAG: hypothetical protein PVF68_11425 [Acidobacteriota bacterium]|jgi:hypothetical protein
MKELKNTQTTPVATDQKDGDARIYESPTIRIYSDQEILEIVGPAQGYSGDPTGTAGGGSF